MTDSDKYKNLSIDQMSRANTLLQRLVDGVNKRWNGGKAKGLSAYEAYEIIDRIYQIINEEQKGNETETNH